MENEKGNKWIWHIYKRKEKRIGNMFNINDFKVYRKSVSVNSNKPPLSFNQNKLLESTKKLNLSMFEVVSLYKNAFSMKLFMMMVTTINCNITVSS